jgi:hypothetical protein
MICTRAMMLATLKETRIQTRSRMMMLHISLYNSSGEPKNNRSLRHKHCYSRPHITNLPSIRFCTSSSTLTFRIPSVAQLSMPECIVNNVPAKKLVSATPTKSKSGVPETTLNVPNPARIRRSNDLMVRRRL